MTSIYLTLANDAHCVSLLKRVDYSSGGMAQYMPEAHRTKENIDLADEILARKYETERQSVSRDHGFSFCMEPEIFDCIQEQSNNAVILELGAAEGDISVLLALGKARKVYVNDILPEQIEKFETTKRRLPTYAQEKLTSICCDYMQILDRQPELRGSCDFVLFRNGFHFLRDADYTAFFGLLRSVLKPGGKFVMNANLINWYVLREMATNPTIVEAFSNPDFAKHPSRFSNITVRSQNAETKEEGEIYRSTSILDEDVKPIGFELLPLYTRVLNGRWELNQTTRQQIQEPHLSKISEAIKKVRLRDIKAGQVIYVTNTSRYFTPLNLAPIFFEHGFHVISCQIFNQNGHIIPELINSGDMVTLFSRIVAGENLAKLGIIAQLPE